MSEACGNCKENFDRVNELVARLDERVVALKERTQESATSQGKRIGALESRFERLSTEMGQQSTTSTEVTSTLKVLGVLGLMILSAILTRILPKIMG